MFKSVAIAGLILILCACASSPSYNGPAIKSTKGYTSFAVVVDAVPTIDDSDVEKAKQELAQAVVAKITASTSLISADDPAKTDLVVHVHMTGLRYLSGGHRFWMGALAGHATLAADSDITERKTGSVLWKLSVDTTSSSWDGIFGSTSDSQFDALGEQISAGMRANI